MVLHMKNKKAGERKRTCTVTIGPKTEAVILKLIEASAENRPGFRLEFTTMVSCLVGAGILRYCEIYEQKCEQPFGAIGD